MTMTRRSLLVSAVAWALGSCQTSPEQPLRLQVLKDSLPVQLVASFPGPVKAQPTEQLESLYRQLWAWQHRRERRSPWPWGGGVDTPADLVTLGDFWLQAAIQQRLIEPLALEKLSGWARLPQPWQTLVRRNDQGEIDPQGRLWGAPYRWGTTVIAYDKNRFRSLGWVPQDWSDLWRPELQGHISLLNQPREVIGLTLKKLGYSYNTPDLRQVPDLVPHLRSLNRQARFYSSDSYLQALVTGDTWVAVGWSKEVLDQVLTYPQLQLVIPAAGSAVWNDLWVRPRGGHGAGEDWIDYGWQPRSATWFSQFNNSTSPVLAGSSPVPGCPGILFPEPSLLRRCEFLQPLAAATVAQYESLWQITRSG